MDEFGDCGLDVDVLLLSGLDWVVVSLGRVLMNWDMTLLVV